MRMAKGFSRQNELTFKLLLTLCVRKMELCAARWEEFDLMGLSGTYPKNAAKTAMLSTYRYPHQQSNG
jgi:integrase